jgi:hypothetical protein
VQTAPGGGDRLNGLSWGFDIMEALDHSAMIGPDDRFVRVASLEELRAKRMIVAKGERCPDPCNLARRPDFRLGQSLSASGFPASSGLPRGRYSHLSLAPCPL